MRVKIYRYALCAVPADHCLLESTIAPDDADLYESVDEERPFYQPFDDGTGIPADEDIHPEEQRTPALLRVNKQIYFEAFPILYGKVAIVAPRKGRWRYKHLPPGYRHDMWPGLSLAYGNESPVRTSVDSYWHPSPRFDSPSPIEPEENIFLRKYAYPNLESEDRFKRISLIVHFDLAAPAQGPRLKYTGVDSIISPAREEWITRKLSKETTIRTFIDKVEKVAWVDHLDLDLYIMAWPPRSQRVIYNEGDFEERQKIWHKGDMNFGRVFLESGVLDPLEELHNARVWCVHLTVTDVDEDPPFGHERMVLDLSGAVHKRQ